MNAYDYAASKLDIATLKGIDAFWETFSRHADAIDNRFTVADSPDVDLAGIMRAALDPISDELMWEFGPSDRGHALTITAEWRDELRPLAMMLQQRAPDLPRWRFHEVRHPVPADEVAGMISARLQAALAIGEIEVSVGEYRAIDLAVSGKASEDDLVRQAVLLFSLLMGEAQDRIWLGEIAATRPAMLQNLLSSKKQGAAPDMAKLKLTIHECIDKGRGMAADLPFCDLALDDRSFSTLQPAEPGVGSPPYDDLIVLTSSYPEMSLAQMNGKRFASERFSKFGETFATLKLPKTDGHFDDLDERYALEEKFHEKLAGSRTGGVIGGAYGQSHAYIDIALLHVGDAIDVITELLRAENAPRQTALHFAEPGLDAFSVPVWPDSAASA